MKRLVILHIAGGGDFLDELIRLERMLNSLGFVTLTRGPGITQFFLTPKTELSTEQLRRRIGELSLSKSPQVSEEVEDEEMEPE